MSFAISIDFGSAYTKVAIRQTMNEPSQLITEESLVLDPHHFCIPTLAAVDERAGKPRWAYGSEAIGLAEGNGIRIFRNWKSQLFAGVAPLKAVGVGQPYSSRHKVSGRSARNGVAAPAALAETDPEIKEVTLRFFTWLRKFLAAPCARLGIKDVGSVPVRLSVPAFGASREARASEALLLEILGEAGWNTENERPIITEPEANVIGIYSQGKNATWVPPGEQKEYPHAQRMFDFGGYMPAWRRRWKSRDNTANHCVLVIDIGAYTTDVAFLRFDLDNEEKAPAIICQSWALGVERLDQASLRRLPEAKSKYIARLDCRRREELKHAVFVEEAPYRLDKDMTIGGAGSEMRVFRDCVRAFGKRACTLLDRFMNENNITEVHEVVLTGGGNMIPRLSSSVIRAIARRDVGLRLLHSPGTVKLTPQAAYRHEHLDASLVRGSTAIGGASIYFEPRLW